MAVRMDPQGDGSIRGQGQANTPPASTTVSSGGGSSTTAKPAPSGPLGPSSGQAYMPKPWENVHVDTSSLAGVSNASSFSSPTWNEEESRKDAYLAWNDLDRDTQDRITQIAKSKGGRSGKVLWETAVDWSEKSVRNGNPQTPWDFFSQGQQQGGSGSGSGSGGSQGGGGGRRSGGGSGGSGGGSGGISQSISYDNAPALDVRSIADSVAMEFLGRGVTQDEMKKILARVRVYENNNPSVSTGQSGAGVSMSRNQGGATSAGRQQVIEKILAKNPEFGDYQKATTMMDWFGAALNERLQNG